MDQKTFDELRKPFHPSNVVWKPGAVKDNRALALAYANLRAYMNRLDEVCGDTWSVSYEPWGEDRIICRLTIDGITRSSTGETTNEAERSEIGGTVAEAQAFKRAAAMFGLGRYLYNLPTGWADFDPKTKRFTEQAKAKLMGILVQQYRRATDAKGEIPEVYAAANDEDATSDATVEPLSPEKVALLTQLNALGDQLYGDQWEAVCRRNVNRISENEVNQASNLTTEQIQKLIAGMQKLLDGHVTAQ